MSWKKWMVALTTFAAATQLNTVSADVCGDDYSSDCGFSLCDCNPCEGWSAYVDYLYWKVRKCDLDYALLLDGVNDSPSKKYDVCNGYDSGVRAGLLKACGDADFGVHYTYFCSDNDSKKKNPDGQLGKTQLQNFGNTVNNSIQYASGAYDIELNQVDLEMGYHLELSDCLASRAFFGFRYASINQEFDIRYAESSEDPKGDGTDNAADLIKKSNNLDFYGLYVGNKASYKMSDCFDAFGGLALGLGVGDTERSYKASTTSGGGSYTDISKGKDDCWRSIAFIDLNVGVTFPLCEICCVDWAFSIGYEFHHWINTADFMSLIVNPGDGESIQTEYHFDRNSEDLGFDGLFVRISAAF